MAGEKKDVWAQLEEYQAEYGESGNEAPKEKAPPAKPRKPRKKGFLGLAANAKQKLEGRGARTQRALNKALGR